LDERASARPEPHLLGSHTVKIIALAAADRPDARVGLVDLDPQGSLTRWWNARALPQPLLVQMAPEGLARARVTLRGVPLDLLVLDCPPGFSPILELAVAAADLVLVPTGPGELDLAAVASTAAMAERTGTPFRYVLNRAVFRSRLAGNAVAALGEGGRMLGAPVHQRVAIAAAMAGGRTALEDEPSGAAAHELAALWEAAREALAGRSGWRRLRTLYGGSSYDPRRAGGGPAAEPQGVNQYPIGTPLRPPTRP
jgi:chromosome partitioning protein